MTYIILSFLILIASAFLVAGICMIVYAGRIEQWMWQQRWRNYRKFANTFRMKLDEWGKNNAPLLPSQNLRLWGTRIGGGTITALAAIVLSFLIAAIFRI